MTSTEQSLHSFLVVGFDTMGTLLDERKGLAAAFEPTASHLSKRPEGEEVHEKLNVALASQMKKDGASTAYRTIMARAHRAVTLDLSDSQYTPNEEESLAFADGLKKWPAFPDTVEALQSLAKNSKLVLLSNMDTETLEYIAGQGALQHVPIAACIGRDKSHGFKPDHRVNQSLVDAAQTQFGVSKEKILLVAQGIKSDHVPAKEMGLSSAWIDRYGGGESALKEAGVRPQWVFGKLSELVEEMHGSRAGH
ncbi:HAD-like protein [Myriangium duriaei CBS 260.36]|uniref:HAD-like protein n=1 Tax=Myriangium duriaei CBS 260.36 TaxID=1168546 RepID=A0A9P4J9H2_9PEZI|nr:HAD-like protein [Myriangium duriaei CBS 260.36]